MYTFRFLYILVIISSCQNSTGVNVAADRNTEASKDFHPYLKEGDYDVEYHANKELTTEQKKIFR